MRVAGGGGGGQPGGSISGANACNPSSTEVVDCLKQTFVMVSAAMFNRTHEFGCLSPSHVFQDEDSSSSKAFAAYAQRNASERSRLVVNGVYSARPSGHNRGVQRASYWSSSFKVQSDQIATVSTSTSNFLPWLNLPFKKAPVRQC